MIRLEGTLRALCRLEGYVKTKALRNCVYDNVHHRTVHSITEDKNAAEYDINEHFQVISSKIVYNSYLQSQNSFKTRKTKENQSGKKLISDYNRPDVESNLPVALKLIFGKEHELLKKETGVGVNKLEDTFISFPYSDSQAMSSSSVTGTTKNYLNFTAQDIVDITEESDKNSFSTYNWMSDYECYDESNEGIDSWQLNYGTPNAAVPVSKVPCGGCGALLHCQDPAIPGYLPSELFTSQDKPSLRSIVCQRCHFMRNYNAALSVIVSPDDYPQLLAHLKYQRCLIILMVDLLDFPCSIWPGLTDIIGFRQPIVVVGNKVDLLPPDCRGYLAHVEEGLTSCMKESNIPSKNIKHIALISAKTGYGVEELITKIHNIWHYSGDVYLLGCTNVGKSTLFNALLRSDFCKVQAVDLVQRATTSPWPGTTLSLLKFPILRPEGWRLYERTCRLASQRQIKQEEEKLRKLQLKEENDLSKPTLIGHIGLTFYKQKPEKDQQDPFSVNATPHVDKPAIGLDPSDALYQKSKWCYDTPGVVHPDQVIHLLTTEELMMTLPKKLLIPRTFRIKPYYSLFIGGLGRLDYIEAEGPVMMTVFASDQLPITVCQVEDAEDLYRALLGTKLLGVPCGGPSRLACWPALETNEKVIQLEGCGWRESCADIVLSSAGWITITMKTNACGKFHAWTPKGRGVYIRKPALLRYSVNLRGSKIKDTPAYRQGKAVFWDQRH